MPPKSPPKEDRSTLIGLSFGACAVLDVSTADLRFMVRSDGFVGRGMVLVCVETEIAPCMSYRARQLARLAQSRDNDSVSST